MNWLTAGAEDLIRMWLKNCKKGWIWSSVDEIERILSCYFLYCELWQLFSQLPSFKTLIKCEILIIRQLIPTFSFLEKDFFVSFMIWLQRFDREYFFCDKLIAGKSLFLWLVFPYWDFFLFGWHPWLFQQCYGRVGRVRYRYTDCIVMYHLYRLELSACH